MLLNMFVKEFTIMNNLRIFEVNMGQRDGVISKPMKAFKTSFIYTIITIKLGIKDNNRK